MGRGEQGVFHAEPYKGELLPLWGFKSVEAARESSRSIYEKFLGYKREEDFVGMDVARKYLQMGFTRSRRYAKYKGGKKSEPRETEDPVKQEGFCRLPGEAARSLLDRRWSGLQAASILALSSSKPALP